MLHSSACIPLVVRLRGGDAFSTLRGVSGRLRRRNGRESEIMGLVGAGVGEYEYCGNSNGRDELCEGRLVRWG